MASYTDGIEIVVGVVIAPTSRAHDIVQFIVQVIGVFIILLLAIGFYFIPTFVADARHKRNLGAIFVLNLLLGWTLVGWTLALVWAMTHDATLT